MDLPTRSGRRLRFRILTIALLAIASVLVPGVAGAAACFDGNPNEHDNQPVTSDVTLTQDIINCNRNGIEVAKGGVTINLAGHTIDGDNDNDTNVGILINGVSNVRILGAGTIKEFGTGIRVNDADGTRINGVTIQGNQAPSTGILVTQRRTRSADVSDNTFITNNTVTGNQGSGVIVYRNSAGTRITGNNITNNTGDGIFLGGAGEEFDVDGQSVAEDAFKIAVSNARVSTNTVTGNAGSGIAIDAEAGAKNRISGNASNDNGTNITFPATTGHESRRQFNQDFGGHGIKVAGKLRDTVITGNTTNGNGTPPAAVSTAQRNGAGIHVVGRPRNVEISSNGAVDNARGGIFVSGEPRNVSITGNTVNANVQNQTSEEGAIFVTGASRATTISENNVANNLSNGIKVEGHNKELLISQNQVISNDPPSSFDNRAGIRVIGRSVLTKIVGNTSNSNSAPSGNAHGVHVEGSFLALQVKGNTAISNDGAGIQVWGESSRPNTGVDPEPESADQDCDVDPDDVPNVSGGCPDTTFNNANNVKVTGNTTNSNGQDGIFLVSDVTLANNVANNNINFGIEHNPDPTVRDASADPTDGPHVLVDAGGNSATGNGTNCSPGISC